jgi:ribosomal-protein-alanine N-acetyltransferase
MLIDDPLPPGRKSEPTELGKLSQKRPPRRSGELGSREAVMSMGRTEKEQARVHIRWMIRRDMPEVLQIETQSFEFAWTEEDFLRCLRQRNCIGMVAEHGEKVVGFMIYELHKAKLHIMNFAVHPQWRRLGVGAQMVVKLISKLSSHRRTRVTLEVRETNLPAQLFFHKQDFRAVRVLRGFYGDSGEDAFLMEYRFGNAVPEEMEETVNRIAQFEEN